MFNLFPIWAANCLKEFVMNCSVNVSPWMTSRGRNITNFTAWLQEHETNSISLWTNIYKWMKHVLTSFCCRNIFECDWQRRCYVEPGGVLKSPAHPWSTRCWSISDMKWKLKGSNLLCTERVGNILCSDPVNKHVDSSCIFKRWFKNMQIIQRHVHTLKTCNTK